MSKKSQNINIENIKDPINLFSEFLNSKDLALQPISFLSESDCDLKDSTSKIKHLSLNHKNNYEKKKSSGGSKKSNKTEKSENSKKLSQKSFTSQKSTSNTNKNRKKSIKESNLYSSNIVIIHDDDCSSTDPIEREV